MKPLVAAVPTPEVKVTIGQMRVPSDVWVRIVLCPLYQGGYGDSTASGPLCRCDTRSACCRRVDGRGRAPT